MFWYLKVYSVEETFSSVSYLCFGHFTDCLSFYFEHRYICCCQPVKQTQNDVAHTPMRHIDVHHPCDVIPTFCFNFVTAIFNLDCCNNLGFYVFACFYDCKLTSGSPVTPCVLERNREGKLRNLQEN